MIGASTATLVSQIVRIGGGLLIVPYLLQRLGVDQYGLLTLMVSLMTIFSLLESVLTPVLRNELIKARAVNEIHRLEHLVLIGLSISTILLMSLIPLMVCLNLINWAPLLGIPAHMPVNSAVLAASFVGVLGACTGFVDCIYAAWNDLTRLRLYEAFSIGLSLLCVVVIAYLGMPLVWIIVAITIPVPAIRLVAFILFVRTQGIPIGIDVQGALKFFLTHRTSSASFAGTQALACIASLFPFVLISRWYGLEDISTYTVTQRLIGAPATLVISIFPVFWPQIARSIELGDHKWLSKTLGCGFLLLVISTAIWTISAYMIGSWFVNAWTKDALTISASFLGLFAVLSGAQVIQGWLSTFLNALGDFRYQLFCYVLFTFSSVIFGTLGLARFGLEGLTLGLILSTSILGIVPMAMRVHRRINNAT